MSLQNKTMGEILQQTPACKFISMPRANKAPFMFGGKLRLVRPCYCCKDCGKDTMKSGEYYNVLNPVWEQANKGNAGMLCLDCLETRLGRALTAFDFSSAPINFDQRFQRVWTTRKSRFT